MDGFFGFGLVGADRSLYNVVGIDIPADVVAGSEFVANFSFDYLDDHVNPDSSPLIIQLNFSSYDEEYPVWRGDFEVFGHIERSALWGLIPLPSVYFECSNVENQLIVHPLDTQAVYADNGTFYCYNGDGDLELEERDEVYLNIVSHYALYPGEYNLTASMFYLTDGKKPFVNITNKNIFERYYREIDHVLIEAEIDDASEIVEKWGNVFLGYENLTIPFSHRENELYYFTRNTPVDIVEGYYELYIFAEDEFGNVGNDSVLFRVDRTPPVVELIVWEEDVQTGMMPILVNVTDEKAGVDNESVEYRLREMNGSAVCPEDGVGTWDCYDSGWLPLVWMSGDLFGTVVNTEAIGLNGEYWLEVRALDVLGNEGALEGEDELVGDLE